MIFQVANNLSQASNQSQIINNGPYLIQQNVDNEHTIITATARSTTSSVRNFITSFFFKSAFRNNPYVHGIFIN